MTRAQLEAELLALHQVMDSGIDGITEAAAQAQQDLYDYLLASLERFDITNGRYVVGQDFSRIFGSIQKKFNSVLGDVYRPSITEYLNSYSTVEEVNVALQRDYNQVEVDVAKIAPARKSIYKQAEYYLKDGVADAYVQPVKYLLMQQVTQGITLKDSRKILLKWHDGELAAGSQLTSGRPTPNLTKYATQVSRDSLYGYNGTINEIIADEYELDSFIYTGDIIEDSRPFCRHLVSLKRKIKLDELPALIRQFPQGLKPNTTKKNFFIVRGGYSCRHQAMAVHG